MVLYNWLVPAYTSVKVFLVDEDGYVVECTVGKADIETLLFAIKIVLIIRDEDCSLVAVILVVVVIAVVIAVVVIVVLVVILAVVVGEVTKCPPMILTHKSS